MADFEWTDLDDRAVKLAKVLSADAVQKAGHGHPGSPVSLAPVAYTLYQHFIKHDPKIPSGRDAIVSFFRAVMLRLLSMCSFTSRVTI